LPELERQTLHVVADGQRVAIVDTVSPASGTTASPLIRYQLGNHLGSSSLELDAAGSLITYEEYFPYGGTSYQAGRNAAEVRTKRYRFTGKERDEESGFAYHTGRYYVPWLGRWLNCDPSGIAGGANLYEYGASNPLTFVDPSGHGPMSSDDVLNELVAHAEEL